MLLKDSEKGQAALEYLMTHAWGLIVLGVTIGIIIAVFGNFSGTSTCTSDDNKILYSDHSVSDTGVLTLLLGNGTAHTINSASASFSGDFSGNANVSPPPIIATADFSVTGNTGIVGSRGYHGIINLSYTTSTGISHIAHITCTGSTGGYSGGGATGVWYNDSWQYRQALSIKANKVAANENDYVLTVIVPAANSVFSKAKADGSDILFTSSDKTTKLNHEVEQFVPASKIGIFRVKVPSISTIADTNIYMYYGNASATPQQNPTAVYRSGYGLFYKMDLNGQDSTIKNRDVVASIGAPSADNTVLGLGVNFNITPNRAWSQRNLPYWEQAWSTRTQNVVFKTGANITNLQTILAEGLGTQSGTALYIYNRRIYAIWWVNDTAFRRYYRNPVNISINTTYYATAVYNYPGNTSFYLNGSLIDSNATTMSINAHPGDGGIGYTGVSSKKFYTTAYVNYTGYYCRGITVAQLEVLDEAWNLQKHKTWYNNLSSNPAFLSFGTEETK